MNITITTNTQQALKNLGDLGKKQLPFATAKTLTELAQGVKAEEEKQLDIRLDRPVLFTKRSLFYKSATKSRLVSLVGIKDKQAEYLKYAIEGGVRKPANRVLNVPGDAVKLNQYGNISRPTVKRLYDKGRAKDKFFIGKPKGGDRPYGIWERKNKNKKLALQILFEKKASYKERFDYYRYAKAYIDVNSFFTFSRNMQLALRTAR